MRKENGRDPIGQHSPPIEDQTALVRQRWGYSKRALSESFIGGVNDNMAKITKEERINEELERIRGLFEIVDANQKAAVFPLIQNAAFMKVTLEDLQASINQDGATDEYKNGANQHGMKQSANLQAYNSLIKNYASVIKTLAGLLPPDRKQTSIDRLQQFMNGKPQETDEERKQREAEYEYWAKSAAELRKKCGDLT